ncbi:hypothetical protein ETAA8_45670 [Anatilimnocola aggregata]|uniref:Uncharacterized protein n=1 Tax=Anatilimnocola aggregata TaxID=2528021 RepID=A0A517YGV3_9BACT|nr:hypothetical protein ETAA8_45670 [Anatilimnocola aggregata]
MPESREMLVKAIRQAAKMSYCKEWKAVIMPLYECATQCNEKHIPGCSSRESARIVNALVRAYALCDGRGSTRLPASAQCVMTSNSLNNDSGGSGVP